MQEALNNCFVSKIITRSFARWKQANTSAEIQQLHATLQLYFGTHAYLFLPDKGSCYGFFQPEIIVSSFLHLMIFFCKVIINHTALKALIFYSDKVGFINKNIKGLIKIWNVNYFCITSKILLLIQFFFSGGRGRKCE